MNYRSELLAQHFAFSPPARPEVFSSLAPLPSYMQLESLINVQNQRLVAGVIRSLVTGQHLVSHVQYPVSKKLSQKCVKLRGLNSDTLDCVYASLS
jgi:Gdp/GTP exchange factor required for growth at low temperatures